MLKTLSKSFTLHLVDLPGMGLSETINPYHLYSVAEQISEHLPNNTSMVGWSLGGQVAMRIALDQPEVVKKLVLVGATPCFVNVGGISTQTHWHHGVDQDVFEKFSDSVANDYHNTIMSFLTLQCMGSRSASTTIRSLRGAFATQPDPVHQVLRNALDILLETDLRDEVSRIRQPTLIIHGDKDKTFPIRNIKNVTHLVKNGNHFMIYKKAKEISSILKSYLN